MNTAWSHLPNAHHIDRILADVRANPDNWDRAWDRVYSVARDAALDAAWNVAWYATEGAAGMARLAALNRAYDAAGSAILALIAWPGSAEYLNLPVEQVRVLAALGDQRAVLMLSAVIVFERSKEIVCAT